MSLVDCPICAKSVPQWYINTHLDENCGSTTVVTTSAATSPSIHREKTSSSSFLSSLSPAAKRGKSEEPSSEGDRQQQSSEGSNANNSHSSSSGGAGSNLKMAAPLAEQARPTTLEEYFGQTELVGMDTMLRKLIEQDRCPSLILWGPPGSGKTTLAKIISKKSKQSFVTLSAVNSGVNDVKSVVNEARSRLQLRNQRTILFLDEIHRYSKSQQDVLLPHVEQGIITLIGATTENPSFSINSALLSRCRVFILNKLSNADLIAILQRALKIKQQNCTDVQIKVSDATLTHLADICDGDARAGINALEMAIDSELNSIKSDANNKSVCELSDESIKEALLKSHLIYDRNGEEHYNIISALHKSIRGSDPTAAMYWLCRMLEAGEDARFIARRLVVCASEDIGLGDPQALPLAMATLNACQLVGMPECKINLAHCVAYLAMAKKNNSAYVAYKMAEELVKKHPQYPVPFHLRNAPTTLMKNVGYGKGYKYNHDYEGPVVQDYLPDQLLPKLGSEAWPLDFFKQPPKQRDPDALAMQNTSNLKYAPSQSRAI